MTTPCERLRDVGPAEQPPEELSAHLESCPECRSQAEIDALLRRCLGSLGGGAVPLGLEARTMRRLRQEQPTLDHRQRVSLGAYWLVALLLSGLVLLAYEPPAIGTMAARTLLMVTASALLPAVHLLLHSWRRERAGL